MGVAARAWLFGLALACLGACAPQQTQAPAAGATAARPDPPATAPATGVPATPLAPAATEPAPVASPAPATSQPIGDAPAAEPLLTSCQADTDCEVKDVGSCCGYRPACVHRDARTDPAAVQARCASEGRVGICGFREIQHCQCVSGTCEASPGDNGPLAPAGLH